MQKSMEESLSNVLNYKNEDVVDRFLKFYKIEESEAVSIFQETKKWLWLCSNVNFNFISDDSIIIIDEMWHNFILFTKDYNDFCQTYFGQYIHHQPKTRKENEEWNKDIEKSIKDYKIALKKQYELIYDYLGEETLNKWYVEFADKYTGTYMKSITK
ncbi:hypothetical protein [Flavobacterium sp. KMS]|uniref:hypothetical protein n=1 Tax=Flavobacterium sp. KMS TaxID=1566023 RepID=UPI00068B7CC5|nr:hypothetical protein [Flavobacterium sp. KMS]